MLGDGVVHNGASFVSALPHTSVIDSTQAGLAGAGPLRVELCNSATDNLAGAAPPGNFGRLFDLNTGTSLSSPHVAGLAALFKARRPAPTGRR